MAANEYRVFGPPGTGKTTWVSKQIAQAVERRGPDALIVASFTRAAAQELAGRDLPVPENRIGTLHALCYRALNNPTIAESKIAEYNKWQDVYTLSNDNATIEDAIEQRFSGADDALFNKIQVLRAKMLPADRWPIDAASLYRSWCNWKFEAGYLDFTDLIEQALVHVPCAPGNPAIGFFDEVQDFTPLELQLVRKWGEAMEYIVLAGDDDQCIYSFKGSSPDAFLNPPVDDDHKRILQQSYRMPAAVHAYTDAWIRQVRLRERKDYAPRDTAGAVIYKPTYNFRNPMRLLEDARQYTEQGQTVMFLTSCSYQLDALVHEMRKLGELFHNPYRRKRGDWNPLHPSRGVSTAQRVLAYTANRRDLWAEDAHPWTGKELRLWTPLVKKTGVFRRGAADSIIKALPEDVPVSAEILDRIFEDGIQAETMMGGLGWLAGHVVAEKAKSIEYPLTIARIKGAKALRAKPLITVGTIHSVKGGEADNVYLFPDLSPNGWIEYDNSDTRDSVIRQFYVGMSRARDTLIVCGPGSGAAVRLPVP